MGEQFQLGDITVDVVLKNIKNVHLSVYPPAGRVRIAASERMDLATIRVFAISKLDWIKEQQTKLREQARETPREYLNRESHYLWGQRYLLTISEADAPPAVEVEHKRMFLSVRPGTDESRRAAIVETWYREQLKVAVPPLIAKWEPTHNARFISLMDGFMPRWQFYRDELNRLPVRHEHWAY
jgi:predicted metal-dependent hydrolase